MKNHQLRLALSRIPTLHVRRAVQICILFIFENLKIDDSLAISITYCAGQSVDSM